MSRDSGLLWILCAALGLLSGMATAAGRGWLAGLTGLGSLGFLLLAGRRTSREMGPVLSRALAGSALRVVLVLGLALGCQELLVRSRLALDLAGSETQRLTELLRWGGRVEGPLKAVVFGPEGHRKVRAAEAVLEGLRRSRPETEVGRRDPARSGPVPGLGRAARLGEVMISAGGRSILVADASLRSLCAGLRALADAGHREVRFLHPQEGPGAPPGLQRGAAALAGELGAAATFGPPVARARVWIWVEGRGPVVGEETIRRHLSGGGALLVFAESPPDGGLGTVLAGHGLGFGEGWLLDDEGGSRRSRAELRVRRLGEGEEPAVLAGARALRITAPGTPLLEPVSCRETDLGRDPDAGGDRRARARGEVPAGVAVPGHGWLLLVGDRDLPSDASLKLLSNRELWVELGAQAMDRTLGLPREVLVPEGGIDPALFPEVYRKLAFLLLIGLPGLPLLAALACGIRGRRRSAG